MKLHEMGPAKGSRRRPRRVGRGPGSGRGKTAGRGSKGQKSRSGYRHRPGFEGGQMPLTRRVPKRGFTNIFRRHFSVVNLWQLEIFEQTVDPSLLVQAGLARRGKKVKILGKGELTKPLVVRAHGFSAVARGKVESAGGSCEELSK